MGFWTGLAWWCMFSTSTEFWLYHIDSYCIYSIASWLNQYLHWTKVQRTPRKSQRYSSCHTRCKGMSLRLGLVPGVLIKHKKHSFDQIWLGNTTTCDGFEAHSPHTENHWLNKSDVSCESPDPLLMQPPIKHKCLDFSMSNQEKLKYATQALTCHPTIKISDALWASGHISMSTYP